MKKMILTMLLFFFIVTDVKAQNGNLQDTLFSPFGTLYGYIFGDYAYQLHAGKQKGGTQQYSRLKKHNNSFNIRRLYLKYDYQFSPNISSHITFAHESGMEANRDKTNLLQDGNRSVFVKHAYLQIDEVIPRATIVLGQQGTPTFSRLSETIWGYRSVEKTVADMRGISASSDLGLGIYGKVGTSERLGYDILFANNSGTKFAPDTYKKLYTSLYAYFLDKKVVVQANYEYNKTSSFPDISGNTQLLKAFISYKTSKTSVGLEAFRQFNKNAVLYIPFEASSGSLTTSGAAVGLSIFYTQTIRTEKLNVFARIDWFNPDTGFKSGRIYLNEYPSKREVFVTIGMDYEVFKNIHIIPNFWLNHYAEKYIKNSSVPGNDCDLVGRITFHYLFNK